MYDNNLPRRLALGGEQLKNYDLNEFIFILKKELVEIRLKEDPSEDDEKKTDIRSCC